MRRNVVSSVCHIFSIEIKANENMEKWCGHGMVVRVRYLNTIMVMNFFVLFSQTARFFLLGCCRVLLSLAFIRELSKPRRRRRGQRRLKSVFFFYLRISQYSKVIYVVCRCQNYLETESRTQR